tara:strand:+ start:5875 stop:6456 length:582 start_codon:yes stop_codon:yes gene_type:complete
MAYSKKSFEDFKDKDLEQYRINQYNGYMADLDEEQVSTEWMAQREMYEWQESIERHENLVCDLLEKAEEGSELESYCTLKELRKLLDDAIKQVEPMAMSKCEQHSPNNSPFTNSGFEIQKRNGGRYIDFSNVPEVAEKEKELKGFKEVLKHALIGVEKGATMLMDEKMILHDGEMVNIPKWKFRKDSITVKKL